MIIAHLKRFVLGTFHGVFGKYLQEYIDEFTYRLNRRYWEDQLPQRLLETAIIPAPIPARAVLSLEAINSF